MEMSNLLRADSFAYFRGGVDQQPDDQFLITVVNHTKGFLNSSWFTDDIDVRLDRVAIAVGQGSSFGIKTAPFPYITRRCNEDVDTKSLSREDIRFVRMKYLDLINAGYSYRIERQHLSGEMSQITRAVSWLAVAREQESHLVKILLYITCLRRSSLHTQRK